MKPAFINPLVRLQEYVTVPIISTKNVLFKPSLEEVELSQSWFSQEKHVRELQRIGVARDESQFPKSELPEITFVGRSNVGKSSLLRALFGNELSGKQKHHIAISSNPGRTRNLFFYGLGKDFCFVDIPGYGANMPTHYENLVENYLAKRTQLRQAFFLIDAGLGILEEDLVGFNMMEDHARPYCVLFTKIDSVKPHILIKNVMKCSEFVDRKLKRCFPQPFLTSSITLEGIPLLRSFIVNVCGKS